MRRSSWIRAGAVAGVCAAVGAVAGIVGSAAAPSKKSSAAVTQRWHGPLGLRVRGLPFFHGPAVHGEEVVLNKARTGFVTLTEDSGKVKSVSGNDVTITEGIGSVTYKDVTVTVPGNATVYRNGSKATVGDLKTGDFVHVASSSDGTTVFADDAKHGPAGPRARWRVGGPPGGWRHGGPPRGLPPRRPPR